MRWSKSALSLLVMSTVVGAAVAAEKEDDSKTNSSRRRPKVVSVDGADKTSDTTKRAVINVKSKPVVAPVSTKKNTPAPIVSANEKANENARAKVVSGKKKLAPIVTAKKKQPAPVVSASGKGNNSRIRLSQIKPGAPIVPPKQTLAKSGADSPGPNQTKVAPAPIKQAGPEKAGSLDQPKSIANKPAAAWPQPFKVVADDSQFEAVQVEDVRPASFQDITPGETTVDQLHELLGEPKTTSEKNGAQTLTYQIGPFPAIAFAIDRKKVSSIVIHMDEPMLKSAVVEELELRKFRPSPVYDEAGKTLGAVYPERGIMLSFLADSKPSQVTQIVLDQISAESFLLRAKHDREGMLGQNLADLHYTESLTDQFPEALYLQARILAQLDRADKALPLLEKARARDPNDARFSMLQAELYWRSGRRQAAVTLLEQVVDKTGLPGEVRAWGERLRGDFLAHGKNRDYHQAFQRHLFAIKLAAPQIEHPSWLIRSEARRVQIDANMAIANDLAWGEWRRKAEVVPKWVAIADQLVEKHLQVDHSSPSVQLTMLRRALAAYSGIEGLPDASAIAKRAATLGHELVSDAKDPLNKRRLEWELAETLYYASRCEQRNRHFDTAISYAQSAAEIVDKHAKTTAFSRDRQFLIGRIYFQIGSIHAISKNDHEVATQWFEKCKPFFGKGQEPAWRSFAGGIGDRMVSMGVSYWKTGKRADALQVTERGLALIKMAIADGERERSALEIPYGNIVSMHRVMGNAEKANALSREKASAKLETARQTTSGNRRR